MKKLLQVAAIAVVGLGLTLAAVGCGSSPSSRKDKMGGDKMGADKMGGDKMGGDKMKDDKMKDDKMKDDKMK